MKLAVFVALAWLSALRSSSAQQTINMTEDLDFNRPESWAMKYFTSVSILTGMGVPEAMGAGAIDLGFEGGFVPQLSDEERRVGFNGTKLENLNRTRFFGRIRGAVGLSRDYSLELAYLPPIEVGGARPHIFSAGIGRPFRVADRWHLGILGYGQFGIIEGDITCAAEEAAAGADRRLNPFGCEEPSNDKMDQRLLGIELTTGYISNGRWRPFAGVSFNYLALAFQVDARYSGVVDRTRQTTRGGTLDVTAGLAYLASPKWRFSGEIFYSPLSVVRPPDETSQNNGLLNARFLITYRLR